MVHFPLRWLLPSCLPAALLASALTARAEPDAKPAGAAAAPPFRPDPLDPKARAPALTYESSFSKYRRLGDQDPVAWREANDTVTRIGGWRAYAREVQGPALPPTTNPPAASASMPSGTPAAAPMRMQQGQSGHKTP
jgi:hypothetical protein